jgi:NADPH-dependent ferric siderophore reductase
MARVTLIGPELEGLEVTQPASSVRVVVASPGAAELIVPEWTGNEFLLPDGARPALRTFTPRRLDPIALELDLDIVLHEGGVISAWAAAAAEGDRAAVSGPARGYDIEPEVKKFVLLGDETALAAIGQLLEAIPQSASVEVHVEVARADAQLELPSHAGAQVEWHPLGNDDRPGNALVAAVMGSNIEPGTRVWAAGEAAGMQRIRSYLFDEVGLTRAAATVRGYWKAR